MGHSCGGASISYALEHYPNKISKAIFVSATMVSNGQRPYDLFAEEVCVCKLQLFFVLFKALSLRFKIVCQCSVGHMHRELKIIHTKIHENDNEYTSIVPVSLRTKLYQNF